MPDEAMIEPLLESQLELFFGYLNDHLRDNGTGEHDFFQPLSAGASLPQAKREAISRGLAVAFGEPGWRRAWVARAPDGALVAHIDLRGRAEAFTAHRCQLGLGVHRDFRGRGLGTRMLDHALNWAQQQTALDWVDLEAFSSNSPAVHLYHQAGFVDVGRMDDLFRIDGHSIGSITMSKRLTRGLADQPR